MKNPPKVVLWIGVLGGLAAVFNFFFNNQDGWMNMLSLVMSMSLVFAYYDSKAEVCQEQEEL